MSMSRAVPFARWNLDLVVNWHNTWDRRDLGCCPDILGKNEVGFVLLIRNMDVTNSSGKG